MTQTHKRYTEIFRESIHQQITHTLIPLDDYKKHALAIAELVTSQLLDPYPFVCASPRTRARYHKALQEIPLSTIFANDTCKVDRITKLDVNKDTLLGSGAFGKVFPATITVTQRQANTTKRKMLSADVACKIIEHDSVFGSQQWLREIFFLMRLQKIPGVPRLYAYSDRSIFLTKGETTLGHKGAGLTCAELWYVFQDLTETLMLIHGKQIAHRDIKPLNVVLTSDNKPLLVDYGNSIAVDGSFETQETYVTTLYYRPPELLNIEDIITKDSGLDWCKCDVYSFTATLYFLMTGKHICTYDDSDTGESLTTQLYTKILNLELTTKDDTLNREECTTLAHILWMGVQHDPAIRYSMHDIRTELRAHKPKRTKQNQPGQLTGP